jgi:hypothetical protein
MKSLASACLLGLCFCATPVRGDDVQPGRSPRTIQATGRLVPSGQPVELVFEIDDGPATFKIELPEAAPGWRQAKKEDAHLAASFAEAAARAGSSRWLPSLEFAGQKGKFFDDGLVAALELALEEGMDGVFVGTRRWLAGMCSSLLESLASAPAGQKPGARQALLFLATAAALGGQPLRDLGLDRQTTGTASKAAKRFIRQDRLMSTPISLYTWSPELTRIFQRTRWLMRPFDGTEPDQRAALEALGEVLRARPDLADGLAFLVSFQAALTNPSREPSLLDLLARPQLVTGGPIYLLPFARSPEVDLLTRASARSPKAGEAMQAFIDEVKRGRLSLAPTTDSGWYDHKLYALEALLRFGPAEERKLRVDARYRKRLEAAFATLLTQTRETHALSLSIAAGPLDRREVLKVRLELGPELELEPLPAYYERLHRAYAFLAEKALGAKLASGWRGLSHLHPGRAEQVSLGTRLDETLELFLGLHLLSLKNLGLPPPDPPPSGSAAALQRAEDWLATWRTDPEMREDVRVITPVLATPEGRLKCWAVLGIRNLQVSVAYEEKPAVKLLTDVQAELDLQVVHRVERLTLSVPVFAEVWLPHACPLSREAFRRICDRHRTPTAIVAALERGAR